MLREKSLDSFKTLYEKRLLKKLMQILNDPITQWDTTLKADAAIGVEGFYSLEQRQTIIKPCFYSLLCQFFAEILIVINSVCTCVKTSAEDDVFERESWGMCLFNFRGFYILVCHKTLLRVSFGLLTHSITFDQYFNAWKF